jgi:predicted amidohydrolase
VVVANAADPAGRREVTCQSGIVSPEGRWIVRADPTGEQFFAYTITL